MNAKRCLSFQTQDKGMMDLEFRKKIKTVIYGCDICQISCPYNKGLDNPLATEIDPDLAHPELIPFIELSNGQFKGKIRECCWKLARQEYPPTQCYYRTSQCQ